MLTAIWYQRDTQELRADIAIEEIPALLRDKSGVLWVDIEAPADQDVVVLTDVFKFHPLCIEDCVHEQQLPKLDEHKDYIFLVVNGIKANGSGTEDFSLVELDLFMGENYLVSVHDVPLRSIDFTRTNLERGVTSVDEGGAALLAHEILDAMVDLYMPVLEDIDDRLQALEQTIEKDPDQDVAREFFGLHRMVLRLRRVAMKEQEVFYWLSHRQMSQIKAEQVPFFRDLHDHMVRVSEMTNTYRETLSGILAIHLSLISNRLNAVMRLLTVFSAILMPLTFIVGIYGMNFDNMPELRTEYGYYVVLLFMLFIAVAMALYFKAKKWV